MSVIFSRLIMWLVVVGVAYKIQTDQRAQIKSGLHFWMRMAGVSVQLG